MRLGERANYQAWRVTPDDFPLKGSSREQLQFFLRYAVLAPSSHNSQPWHFIVSGEEIILTKNPTRLLPVCDPQMRLTYIALGCALTNIIIAADYFGFTTEIENRTENHGDQVAKIHFQKKGIATASSDHHIFAIPRRRVNRGGYETRSIPEPVVSWLRAQSTSSISIDVVQNDGQKRAIAAYIAAGRMRAFSNPAFRQELARYKRTNLTRSQNGMPGFTMGFPTLLSLVAPLAIRLFNVTKLMRRHDDRLFTTDTAAFVIISGGEDSLWGACLLGQKLEQILLEMEARGLATSIQVIGSDGTPLQQILGCQMTPRILFRLGYPTELPAHSPRISSTACTTLL